MILLRHVKASETMIGRVQLEGIASFLLGQVRARVHVGRQFNYDGSFLTGKRLE